MASAGWSDAGTRLPGWLRDADFRDVDEGERAFWWQDEELAAEANYAAEVIESALDSLLQVRGVAHEQLRDGVEELRRLDQEPGARLGWVVHKSTGRK
jgi:hypothetical protein